VAIYARVSTADKNQTVENQLRDLLAVAARQDWEIVATSPVPRGGTSGPHSTLS
jgi:DNA invertase Pin-like site-specific DNA recombinase